MKFDNSSDSLSTAAGVMPTRPDSGDDGTDRSHCETKRVSYITSNNICAPRRP